MYVEKTSTDGEMRSLLAAVKPLKYVLIVVLSHLLFRSHRFRNIQVEVLYQRYFLRMNQNNIASLLVLLICISIVLILVNHVLYTTSESFLVQVSYPQFFFFKKKKINIFCNFFIDRDTWSIYCDVPVTRHIYDKMLSQRSLPNHLLI